VTHQALIVGGGMGGLAAGIACTRAGWEARLYEQSQEFSEVGAGIQLGPNSTRILGEWGLGSAVIRVAAVPRQLLVRSAVDGAELGRLRLGRWFQERYGAPYLTIHRADLQRLLLGAARHAGVNLELKARASAVRPSGAVVKLTVNEDREVQGDALIAADGLWSAVRTQVFGGGAPVATGHLAYGALMMQKDLPASLRSQDVSVWLGPRLHLVAYPVRGGHHLNVVAILEGRTGGAAQDWDRAATVDDLHAAMASLCAPIQHLVRSMPSWRLWALHDRPPVRNADEMVRGRVALLGDAAHPMRPYLAQGAGMAIEDAAELGRSLAAAPGNDVEPALRRYAANRWERCAQVQTRAQRNGRIFHATGVVRWGRDLSMRLLGERLLDQPWLYR
jgi:salicylate hydroxylase